MDSEHTSCDAQRLQGNNMEYGIRPVTEPYVGHIMPNKRARCADNAGGEIYPALVSVILQDPSTFWARPSGRLQYPAVPGSPVDSGTTGGAAAPVRSRVSSIPLANDLGRRLVWVLVHG